MQESNNRPDHRVAVVLNSSVRQRGADWATKSWSQGYRRPGRQVNRLSADEAGSLGVDQYVVTTSGP